MLLSGQTSFYFFACLPGREHISPCTYEGVFKRSLHRTLTTEEIFYQVLHFCVCALKGASRFSLVRDDPIRGANNTTKKDLRTASADQAMTGRRMILPPAAGMTILQLAGHSDPGRFPGRTNSLGPVVMISSHPPDKIPHAAMLPLPGAGDKYRKNQQTSSNRKPSVTQNHRNCLRTIFVPDSQG